MGKTIWGMGIAISNLPFNMQLDVYATNVLLFTSKTYEVQMPTS